MITDLNTAFRHRPFLFAAAPPPAYLLPGQESPVNKFRTAKNIRGTLSAFTQMQAGHGIGAGVVKCTKVRTSWLSSVLGLAGGQGSVESMDFPDIFCLSYMFSLRQVGGKRLTFPCPVR